MEQRPSAQSGQVVARPPFDRLWHGIDPFQWLEEQPGEVVRAMPDRRTFRFLCEGQPYFAKLHRGVGLAEVLRSLASLRLPTFDASTEARAIAALEEAGVPVPEVLAWGTRGSLPHRRHSFVITRDVGSQRTLLDVARSVPSGSEHERRPWIRALARIISSMHAAGINHRDCYLNHVLCPPPMEEPASPHLVLLDLHRAQIRERVPHRWRAKDLGGLAFSALDLALSRTDLMRFVAVYSGLPPARAIRENRALWAAVEGRCRRLVRERERRGERFGR